MPTATASARPNALAALLSRYVAGDVADAAFSAVCDLSEEIPSADRLAFARFYLDVLASGDTECALPRPEEIADVLQIACA